MLNNEYPPLGGGTGTVNREILKHLAGNPDLEIDLVTSSADENQKVESFSKRITIYKIPVDRFNIHHASNKELILYGWRAFRQGYKLHQKKQYDLCFAWSAVPACVSALALKSISGLPYIVRVSGPDIPGFEERYQNLYPVLTQPSKLSGIPPRL